MRRFQQFQIAFRNTLCLFSSFFSHTQPHWSSITLLEQYWPYTIHFHSFQFMKKKKAEEVEKEWGKQNRAKSQFRYFAMVLSYFHVLLYTFCFHLFTGATLLVSWTGPGRGGGLKKKKVYALSKTNTCVLFCVFLFQRFFFVVVVIPLVML